MLLPYSGPPLIKSLLLSTETTGLSSDLLHFKITAQTEILNKPWSRKEKVKQTYGFSKSNGDHRKWTSQITVFNKTNNKRKLVAK